MSGAGQARERSNPRTCAVSAPQTFAGAELIGSGASRRASEDGARSEEAEVERVRARRESLQKRAGEERAVCRERSLSCAESDNCAAGEGDEKKLHWVRARSGSAVEEERERATRVKSTVTSRYNSLSRVEAVNHRARNTLVSTDPSASSSEGSRWRFARPAIRAEDSRRRFTRRRFARV